MFVDRNRATTTTKPSNRSPPSIRSAWPADRRRGAATSSSHASSSRGIPDIPPPLPPVPRYHGVRQRQWGTWVAEIYDRDTGKTHWLGSFHTVEAATRAYDIKSVHLYGAAGRRNFPDGYLPPAEPLVDNQVANACERREDRVARELLAAEAAGEVYMAELRRRFREHVEAERRLYAEYAAGRTEVIELSSDEEGDDGNDGDNRGNVGGGSIYDDPDDGTGPDPMIGGLSRAEWKEVAEESDSD